MAGELELIAAIYDAALDPSRWGEVVRRIAEATKSPSGGLFIQEAGAAQSSAVYNVDPFYEKIYVETWHKHNPLLAVAAAAGPGELRTCTHIFQSEKFRALAFFNEFICPQGWADMVGVGLLRGPNSSGHLVVHRSPGAIWVEPKEWHLLETLAPHLKRAAEVHQLLARERAAKESLGAAIAAAGFAAFLLSKDCRVLFANAKAEDLLRRGAGLRYEIGRLAAAAPSLTQRLHALARAAARPGQAENDTSGTLELPGGESCPPLIAHVFPVAANRAVSILDLDRPAAALFVINPVAELRAHVEHFAAKNGLTAAETGVLGELIGGKGLRAAAAQLKIAENTAHTHAKRIYAKTGAGRQTDLLRRFFETTFPGSSGNT